MGKKTMKRAERWKEAEIIIIRDKTKRKYNKRAIDRDIGNLADTGIHLHLRVKERGNCVYMTQEYYDLIKTWTYSDFLIRLL